MNTLGWLKAAKASSRTPMHTHTRSTVLQYRYRFARRGTRGFPNVLSGSVQVDVTSELNGAAARFRKSLYCNSGCGYSPFFCNHRADVVATGWNVGLSLLRAERVARYSRTSAIHRHRQPGSFNILDHFDTRNQFNGGEIGVLWQGRRGLWSLDGLMRSALVTLTRQ